MGKITYNDKIALNVNSNIEDINKVNAGDMNEIKNVVNGNVSALGTENDTWSTEATYSIGDIVIYQNIFYKNLTGNNSTSPDTDTTNWSLTTFVQNSENSSTINSYNCNFINKKLIDWTYGGNATNQNYVTIPDGWTEVYIVVCFGGSSGYYAAGNINRIILDTLPYTGGSGDTWLFGFPFVPTGGSGTTATGMGCVVQVYTDKNRFRINYSPGQTAASYIYVWYR